MRAQGEVRADDMFAAGFDEAPPPLGIEAARAIHCWGFCGGWRPDVLPQYAALHGLPDWELTTALMEEIRFPKMENQD